MRVPLPGGSTVLSENGARKEVGAVQKNGKPVESESKVLTKRSELPSPHY
jgi:hypothetical protein